MSERTGSDGAAAASAAESPIVLHRRGYLVLLLQAAALGIPISLLAFGYQALVHVLQHEVWEALPERLWGSGPPVWWPLVVLGLAGVLVGWVGPRVPGGGGHPAAGGVSPAPTPPRFLPGVLVVAGISLVLGAVLGPEAPLLAMGSAVALMVADRTSLATQPEARAVIATAGAAAAIAAIFGSPLVAAILLMEVVGFGGRKMMAVLLPCLMSTGVGALLFTGLGSWTGLTTASLAVPDFEASDLRVGQLLWVVPVAAVIAVGLHAVLLLGHRVTEAARSRVFLVTAAAGVLAGGLATLYALLTSRSVTEVALSGQALLPGLAAEPQSWPVTALVLLLGCKALAFGLSLGVFRGGPVFPAVALGAVAGVLAGQLPGLGTAAGLAIGMAATAAAVMRLPVTSVLLVVLLLGSGVTEVTPLVIIAVVVALVVLEALDSALAGNRRVAADP